MRKEYSDLPPEQKLVYIKRQTLVVLFGLIPALVALIILASWVTAFAPAIEEQNHTTNSTKLQLKVEHDDTLLRVFILGLFAITTLIVAFGLIGFGTAFGNTLADRFKWYTDIELDDAKQYYEKIQKEFNKKCA